MRVKEKEYISAILLLSFFGMTVIGLSSSNGPQFLHLVPYVFVVSAVLIIANNKYRNFDNYFFYGLIFILSYIIHLFLNIFHVSILHPNYSKSLGLSLFGVPLLIPTIWLIVISSVNGILRKFKLHQVLSAILGSFLVLVLDVFLEAQAVKFGFWNWNGIDVPIANYIWWVALSFGFILASFKLNIRNNTFVSTITYLLLLIFFAAADSISF